MKRPTSPRRGPACLRIAAMTALSVVVVTAALPMVSAAAASGTIVNLAGSPAATAGNTGDGGPATSAFLFNPAGVAVDSAGNVYIADGNSRIRRVGAGGTISNFAGAFNGLVGNTGDGGPATSALLFNPGGVAVDSAGNVYIADTQNNRVRKVDAGGTITNFAGSPGGTAGNTGDGGLATSATLNGPLGVAVDSAGNVYVADTKNNRIRKINTGGTITNFAGSPAATAGNTGDPGPATSATLNQPSAIAVDLGFIVYIADTGNNRVRKVDTSGTITNFAGSPAATAGNFGDGGLATSAALGRPSGVAFDSAGNVYIADQNNNRMRKVDTSGTITNFAGSPFATAGNTGDGGLPISATLNGPAGVAVDAAGNVYIADSNNNRVREVLPSNSVPVIRPAPALMMGTGLVLVLVGLGVRAARRRTMWVGPEL